MALLGCTAEPTSQAPSSQGGKASVASQTGPGGNHPPLIRTARIYPVDVSLDTALQVSLLSEDVDSDPVTYRYQWFVNGFPAAGATAASFSAQALKPGDRVTVEVTPNDGKADGLVSKADHVTVGNTAPDIAEIHLEPVPNVANPVRKLLSLETLHRGDGLKARVVAGDPDGDPITFTYKWFRNDKEIPGANTDTLDTKDFRKKDVLTVLVSVSDGKATREPRAGRPVTIENAPPQFTSNAPATISLSPPKEGAGKGAPTEGLYEYTATAVDLEDDPITFELKKGPPGMTIDAATGKLTWKLTAENAGEHQAALVAKDNDNGVSEEQTFKLDIKLVEHFASPRAP